MARDGSASRRAVRRVSSPDAPRRLVRTISPSQIAPSDGGAPAPRLVARRRGGTLPTVLHTDLCHGARAKRIPEMQNRKNQKFVIQTQHQASNAQFEKLKMNHLNHKTKTQNRKNQKFVRQNPKF